MTANNHTAARSGVDDAEREALFNVIQSIVSVKYANADLLLSSAQVLNCYESILNHDGNATASALSYSEELAKVLSDFEKPVADKLCYTLKALCECNL